VLAHISPAHSENISFFGSIDVDIEGELAQLGPTGYWPPRVCDTPLLIVPPGRAGARPIADRLACVRAGSRSAVWALQGGDGQKQVLELSTLPGVENVALAPSQGHQRP
jgi:hypothetical protein